MEHLGIDLGASRSAVCRVSDTGSIIKEREVRTAELGEVLARLGSSRVAIESCAESRAVAKIAQELGHEVRIVPATFVRSLGIGARRIKTDKRDARNLAIASFRLGDELPSIHVRSDEGAKLQDLVRARSNLVAQRTSAINFVRAQFRKALLGRGPKATSKTFVARVRDILDEGHGLEIEGHLSVIDALNEQIDRLETKMRELAKTHEDARRLQQISGVGPLVSLSFVATIDEPSRFGSPAQLSSYLGLSPGEKTTGGRVRRTGVIAAGQKHLRALLVQAAHVMLNARRTREPMAAWAQELALRRGRKLAVCALARRLAVVMWAMLRDGTTYDPTRTKPRMGILEERLTIGSS
jgi:transposase